MLTFTDIFYYDPVVGFLRNIGSHSRIKDHRSARFDSSSGYYRIAFGGRQLLEHRVIYEMFNGPFNGDIDHIDRNKLNNKVENLRICTRPQNVVNSKVRKDNPWGYKGVTWHKGANKFAAQTFFKGSRVHIGVYLTKEEAALAYNKKALELFGEYAVLNEAN